MISLDADTGYYVTSDGERLTRPQLRQRVESRRAAERVRAEDEIREEWRREVERDRDRMRAADVQAELRAVTLLTRIETRAASLDEAARRETVRLRSERRRRARGVKPAHRVTRPCGGSYGRGCRCPDCREYHRVYEKERRARQRAGRGLMPVGVAA